MCRLPLPAYILAKIAEQRIREAMERGEFDNLPFHGKPIKLDDLVGVPEHLRMGYKILKNAGVLPEEMQLKKGLLSRDRKSSEQCTCFTRRYHEMKA